MIFSLFNRILDGCGSNGDCLFYGMTDSSTSKPPLTVDEAINPTSEEPTAEVTAWQEAQIRRGIAAADAGKFVTDEELKAIVRKYLPHG